MMQTICEAQEMIWLRIIAIIGKNANAGFQDYSIQTDANGVWEKLELFGIEIV